MMKLQIKDSGSWRNVALIDEALNRDQQAAVADAAAALLKTLRQEKTVMRLAEGDVVLFYCQAPDYKWWEA